MEYTLKPSWEVQGAGQRAQTDRTCLVHRHVHTLLLPLQTERSQGSGVMDLTLEPLGKCSLSLLSSRIIQREAHASLGITLHYPHLQTIRSPKIPKSIFHSDIIVHLNRFIWNPIDTFLWNECLYFCDIQLFWWIIMHLSFSFFYFIITGINLCLQKYHKQMQKTKVMS